MNPPCRRGSRTIFTSLLCMAALSVAAPHAGAQNAPAGKTGVVDLVRVFNDCKQIKDLNEFFRQRRKELSDEAENRRKALDEAEIKVRAFRPDSPDFAKARNDFSNQQIEFKVWTETKQREVQGDEFRWMERMYEECCAIVQKLAEQRGLDLVLLSEPFNADAAQEDLPALQAQIRARKVLYFAPRIDLTPAVIEELDKAYTARGGAASLRGGAPAGAKSGG